MDEEFYSEKKLGIDHYNQSKRHYNREKVYSGKNTKKNHVQHAKRAIVKSMIKNDNNLDITSMDIDSVNIEPIWCGCPCSIRKSTFIVHDNISRN